MEVDLPEGLERDETGEWWSTCQECGHQQVDAGFFVECEECDEGPMPTLPLDYPADA